MQSKISSLSIRTKFEVAFLILCKCVLEGTIILTFTPITKLKKCVDQSNSRFYDAAVLHCGLFILTIMNSKPLRWLVLRGLQTIRVRLRRPSGVLPTLENFLAFHNFY